MEASCTAQWFERLLDRCGHCLQVGDPATIRASVVRKQKTDARDARQFLELLLANRFPSIWIPTPAERDSRQLLVHRHQLVSWRTQVRNQLSALARSQGLFPRTRFWTRGRQDRSCKRCQLDRWAAQRRQDLLRLLSRSRPADRRAHPACRATSARAQRCCRVDAAGWRRSRSSAWPSFSRWEQRGVSPAANRWPVIWV